MLAGRYRVRATVGETDGARVYEADDILLADRRTLVCEVVSEDRDQLAAAWVAADSPWTAPLLDVVAIDGRVCGVFDIDEDAASLAGISGVSREQRASLIVDVARLIDRTAAAAQSLRLVTAHTLWVEGLPAEGRLRAIPIPMPGSAAADNSAADLAALPRLVSQQLFGIDPTEPPASALARLPDAIQAALEPLYSDVPADRLAAGARPDVLHAVLGLSHGASRVPVPVVQGPPPTVGTQLSAASNAARRKSRREIAVAIALLVFSYLFFAPGASREGVVGPVSSVERTPEVRFVESLRYEVPTPEVRTHPPIDQMHPAGDATFFHSVRNDGPIVTGHFELGGPEAARPYDPHARVFYGGGRALRVEQFAPRARLRTSTTYEYDSQGRVRAEVTYLSTGALLSTREYRYRDDMRGVFEGRSHTGAPSPAGCGSVHFTLDGDGRYTSLRCFDIGGERATFPSGYHEERFVYLGTSVTRSHWTDRGRHFTLDDGYHAVRETIDDRGRVTMREFLDEAGDPVNNIAYGATRIEFTWQTGGVSTERLYRGEGQPVLGAQGWHRSVEFRRRNGELSSFGTYDLQYQPVAQTGTTVARINYLSDDNGLVAAEEYFDVRGEPTTDAVGVHRIEYVRDAHNNVLQECHFDLDGRVDSAALDGVSCVNSEQDEYGYVSAESYYRFDGAPTVDSRANVHRVEIGRDAMNRVTRRAYFDQNGEPMTTWAGYHAIDYQHDEWGNVREYAYRSADGSIAETSTKTAVVTAEHDARGRESRRCFFDRQQEPVRMASGFGSPAHCLSWTYSGEFVDELAYTGLEGQPVLATFSSYSHAAAYLHFEWSPAGVLLRQELYDAARVLLETRECTAPTTCISVDGWSWHIP